MPELWIFRSRIGRVIDADTYALECDTGFGQRIVIRVRLADVNAAERFTDAGREATLWVQGWFNGLSTDIIDDWPLIIRTRMVNGRHGLAQDITFNRFVADIWASDGRSLADALVAAGHAVRVMA